LSKINILAKDVWKVFPGQDLPHMSSTDQCRALIQAYSCGGATFMRITVLTADSADSKP